MTLKLLGVVFLTFRFMLHSLNYFLRYLLFIYFINNEIFERDIMNNKCKMYSIDITHQDRKSL